MKNLSSILAMLLFLVKTNYRQIIFLPLLSIPLFSIGQNRDFKFQFNNRTEMKVRLGWEIFDTRPSGVVTLMEISGSLPEKELTLDKGYKYIKFTGRAGQNAINPVTIEISTLKKFKKGVNVIDILKEEEPTGTRIDLGNLISNITNDHFYKLLTIEKNKRLKEDEVLQLGTFVVLDTGNVAHELSRISYTSEQSVIELVNEYSKRTTYFIDKSHIQSYAVSARTPSFAAGVDVTLIDSGFVEFDFRIGKVQHYTWKGEAPYDYLKSVAGQQMIGDIKSLFDKKTISSKAQVYFISSYIKIYDMKISHRSFDKEGRDINGHINANLQKDVGVAVVAKNSYVIKSGVINVDSVKIARIMTSGKNVTPLVTNFISIGTDQQRLIDLRSQNNQLKQDAIAFYDAIRKYRTEINLPQTDNISLIASNVSLLHPILYQTEKLDSATIDKINDLKNSLDNIAIYNKNLSQLNFIITSYNSNMGQIEIIEKRLNGVKEDELKLKENSKSESTLTQLDNKKIEKVKSLNTAGN